MVEHAGSCRSRESASGDLHPSCGSVGSGHRSRRRRSGGPLTDQRKEWSRRTDSNGRPAHDEAGCHWSLAAVKRFQPVLPSTFRPGRRPGLDRARSLEADSAGSACRAGMLVRRGRRAGSRGRSLEARGDARFPKSGAASARCRPTGALCGARADRSRRAARCVMRMRCWVASSSSPRTLI